MGGFKIIYSERILVVTAQAWHSVKDHHKRDLCDGSSSICIPCFAALRPEFCGIIRPLDISDSSFSQVPSLSSGTSDEYLFACDALPSSVQIWVDFWVFVMTTLYPVSSSPLKRYLSQRVNYWLIRRSGSRSPDFVRLSMLVWQTSDNWSQYWWPKWRSTCLYWIVSMLDVLYIYKLQAQTRTCLYHRGRKTPGNPLSQSRQSITHGFRKDRLQDIRYFGQ